MAGEPDANSGHSGTPRLTHTTHGTRPSMGQLGDMILDLNDMLRNEFYPIVGEEKTCRFETIWGPAQSLLSAAAISIAAHAKTTQEPHLLAPTPNTQRHSYATAIQSGPPGHQGQPTPRVQPVPQALTREVRVSRRDCAGPGKGDLCDPAKVVPMLNQAITKFSDGRVEAARLLPSGDLVLRVDSPRTQQDLHKQNGWTEALGAGARLNRPRFTVMIKSVRLEALDCSNQEVARATLIQQNLYLNEVELIHVGRERSRLAKTSARASTVLVDVASPQQANLLIREGVVLGYIHHSAELFHRDCRVTRCYQCQGLGHMARVCRRKQCCGWCTSQEHTDKACPARAAQQPARCINCKESHPAWAGSCPVRQEAAARAKQAFLTRPSHFAEDHAFPPLSRQPDEPRIAAKRKTQSTPSEDRPRARGRPRALDSAGRSQQGAMVPFIHPPSPRTAATEAEVEL